MSDLDLVYNLWDDKEESVQDICSSVSLNLAANRVLYPQLGSYEYQSATLGVTMLAKTFCQNHWAITPESRDGNRSSKRPDLIVELAYKTEGALIYPAKLDDTDQDEIGFCLHLIYEAKGSHGNRFEQALAQVTDDQIPARFGQEQTLFVVIQRGLRFGFFEYHNDKQELDRLGIPHFRGCVPVTYDFHNSDGEFRNFLPIGHQLADTVLPLYHDTQNLRGLSDVNAQAIRTDAERIRTPCVFDYFEHQEYINYILARLAVDRPRIIWFLVWLQYCV